MHICRIQTRIEHWNVASIFHHNNTHTLSPAHIQLPNLNWPAGYVAHITESFESRTGQFTVIGLPSSRSSGSHPSHSVATIILRISHSISRRFMRNIPNRNSNSGMVDTESLSSLAPFLGGRVGVVQPVGQIISFFMCVSSRLRATYGLINEIAWCAPSAPSY